MTPNSNPIPRARLCIAISLALGASTACGGSGADTSPAASSTGGAATSPGGAGSPTGGAAASMGGAANSPGGAATSMGGTAPSPGGAASSGGAATSAGGSATSTGGADSTCKAGTALEGGGADTCPDLPYRCVDRMVGNPPQHLAGAECSPGATGACCNESDKCLVNTNGTAGGQSVVEVAIGPCQAGCATNPSADACVACINGNLESAGHPKLSSGCAACYAALISCSFTNCLTPCLAGADTPTCRECVFGHCTTGPGQFNECSGTLNSAGL